MQIIDNIVEHHLHRVYVVNEQHQAVGVVTLTDLLRKVTEEAHKAWAETVSVSAHNDN